jgi:hypothetical protein
MLLILAAAGNVMFHGWLGWIIAGRIGNVNQANFAGWFLAIGFAIGSFGGRAESEAEAVLAFRGVGYLLGIIVFTVLLLCRRAGSLRRQP